MFGLHGSIIVYGGKRSHLERDPPEKQYPRTKNDAISGKRDRGTRKLTGRSSTNYDPVKLQRLSCDMVCKTRQSIRAIQIQDGPKTITTTNGHAISGRLNRTTLPPSGGWPKQGA